MSNGLTTCVVCKAWQENLNVYIGILLVHVGESYGRWQIKHGMARLPMDGDVLWGCVDLEGDIDNGQTLYSVHM